MPPLLTRGQRLNASSLGRVICIGLVLCLVASCERRPEVVDTTLPEDERVEGNSTQRVKAQERRTPETAEERGAMEATDEKDRTEFACSGAYSNVSFSEESGDGSGVVAILQASGAPKFIFWEGGPSPANAVLTSLSGHTMSVALSFPDYPGQKANATLDCRGSRLFFRSSDLGHNAELHRITAEELADLR